MRARAHRKLTKVGLNLPFQSQCSHGLRKPLNLSIITVHTRQLLPTSTTPPSRIHIGSLDKPITLPNPPQTMPPTPVFLHRLFDSLHLPIHLSSLLTTKPILNTPHHIPQLMQIPITLSPFPVSEHTFNKAASSGSSKLTPTLPMCSSTS